MPWQTNQLGAFLVQLVQGVACSFGLGLSDRKDVTGCVRHDLGKMPSTALRPDTDFAEVTSDPPTAKAELLLNSGVSSSPWSLTPATALPCLAPDSSNLISLITIQHSALPTSCNQHKHRHLPHLLQRNPTWWGFRPPMGCWGMNLGQLHVRQVPSPLYYLSAACWPHGIVCICEAR